jgi:hypothetical protein
VLRYARAVMKAGEVTSDAGAHGAEREGAELARLPLQVGSTAHWSFTRVPIPIGIGLGFILFALDPEINKGNLDDWGAAAVFFLIALTCFAYSAFHGYNAVVRRASDLVLAADGIRRKGGRGRGRRIGWSELSAPYAKVEETTERQLTVVGTLLFVFSRFRAGSPVKEVRVWKLWVYVGGEYRLLAKSDRDLEARSMEAAAQSIACIEEGRRYVAEAPSVPVQGVFCPACGAPAVPADAEHVVCRHCGHAVPMEPQMRSQAAAAAEMRRNRERHAGIIKRLLSQPRAGRTNASLSLLWLLMIAPWPAAIAVFYYYETLDIPSMALGLAPPLLVLVPPAAMLSAWALGRALLVNRGAMQLLTLGFGALAPAREGEAPRCRRCHGSLHDAGVGGVVTCAYCLSDNITGIDLRPFVDNARAEQQTLDAALEARRRAKRGWTLAGVGAFLLLSAAIVTFGAGLAGLSGAVLDREREAPEIVSDEELDDMLADLDRLARQLEGDLSAFPEQEREVLESLELPAVEDVAVAESASGSHWVYGMVRNPNEVGLRRGRIEIVFHGDDDKVVHASNAYPDADLPAGARVPFATSIRDLPPYDRLEVRAKPDVLGLRPYANVVAIEVISFELSSDRTRHEIHARLKHASAEPLTTARLLVIARDERGAIVSRTSRRVEPADLQAGNEVVASARLDYYELAPPAHLEVLAVGNLQ